jgi:hypothetical protein
VSHKKRSEVSFVQLFRFVTHRPLSDHFGDLSWDSGLGGTKHTLPVHATMAASRTYGRGVRIGNWSEDKAAEEVGWSYHLTPISTSLRQHTTPHTRLDNRRLILLGPLAERTEHVFASFNALAFLCASLVILLQQFACAPRRSFVTLTCVLCSCASISPAPAANGWMTLLTSSLHLRPTDG